MKSVFATMFFVFVMVIPFGGIWSSMFMYMVGGGVEQSYIYPIYGGIIILSGVIVCCTQVILEELRELSKKIDENKK